MDTEGIEIKNGKLRIENRLGAVIPPERDKFASEERARQSQKQNQPPRTLKHTEMNLELEIGN